LEVKLRKSRGRFTFDLEANGLWEGKPTDCDQVWCIGMLDHDTKEFHSFDYRNNFVGFKELFESATVLVCHNVLGYDLPVIKHFFNIKPNSSCKVIDTIVWSKSLYPDRKYTGGHGLEAWGIRNGIPKPEIDDWTVFTEDMLHRCQEDVYNGHETFLKLVDEAKEYDSKAMLHCEQKIAEIISKQCYNGTAFDLKLATWLHVQLVQRLSELDYQIKPLLSLRCVPVGAITKGIYKQDGTFKKVIADYWEAELQDINFSLTCTGACTEPGSDLEGSFQRVEFTDPNIGSDQQMKEQLRRNGWVALEFTMKGNGKITEESLLAIKRTSGIAREFISRRQCASRLSMVKGWLERVDEDGRIRGKVNPQGAVTLRMTHSIVVNVPKFDKDEPLSEYYRHCFISSIDDSIPSWDCDVVDLRTKFKSTRSIIGRMALVGCDASGLENRILAHHMDDPELTYVITDGDFHSRVMKTITEFVDTRQATKNIEYALFYGAGDLKLGAMADNLREFNEFEIKNLGWKQIKSGDNKGKYKKRGTKPLPIRSVVLSENGSLIRAAIMAGLPSLDKLTQRVKHQADQGYLTGLDGRRYILRKGWDGKVELHKALNTQLQGDGACVMKYAQCFLNSWLEKRNVKFNFLQTVHDEFQIECDPKQRLLVADLAKKSIIKAGEYLKLNCPLDASADIGYTWGMTH
jgi:DNA polymerase-1